MYITQSAAPQLDTGIFAGIDSAGLRKAYQVNLINVFVIGDGEETDTGLDLDIGCVFTTVLL
jgi:hypothetical protein